MIIMLRYGTSYLMILDKIPYKYQLVNLFYVLQTEFMEWDYVKELFI